MFPSSLWQSRCVMGVVPTTCVTTHTRHTSFLSGLRDPSSDCSCGIVERDQIGRCAEHVLTSRFSAKTGQPKRPKLDQLETCHGKKKIAVCTGTVLSEKYRAGRDGIGISVAAGEGVMGHAQLVRKLRQNLSSCFTRRSERCALRSSRQRGTSCQMLNSRSDQPNKAGNLTSLP